METSEPDPPKKASGATRPSQFRLPVATLAELDALVAAAAAESGDRETRSGVLRKIIHREHVRKFRGKGKQ